MRRLRWAARTSPAFRRTSAPSSLARLVTCASFMASSRSATPTRPAFRPFKSSGSVTPTVRLLSGPVTFCWALTSSIGFGRSPAWSSRPRAASTSARAALRSGFAASACITKASTVKVPGRPCSWVAPGWMLTIPRRRTTTSALCPRMRTLLAHGDRKPGGPLPRGSIPGDRHLPRPTVRKTDRAQIATRPFLGCERGARDHGGHARHWHRGVERDRAHVDGLFGRRRSKFQDERVLPLGPLPGVAQQGDGEVFRLLGRDRLQLCPPGTAHESVHDEKHAEQRRDDPWFHHRS